MFFFFVFQCTDIPLPLFLHFPPKRLFLSGWVKQILQFKSLTWVKCGVNILNDVSSFWPLIILDEILTVNRSLSISKGNGEDSDPELGGFIVNLYYNCSTSESFDIVWRRGLSTWIVEFSSSKTYCNYHVVLHFFSAIYITLFPVVFFWYLFHVYMSLKLV